MEVLSLVPDRYAPFYQKQVEAMNALGVKTTHVFPRKQSPDHAVRNEMSRSILDYVKMYPTVLRESVNNYDLIHANNGKMAPFGLAQPKRPVVLTFYGSDLAKYGVVTKRCAQFCDEVIVMSKKMKTKLNQDAHVIPHGIDIDQFRPIPQTKAQEAIDWDSETTHVLFPYDPSRDVKNYPLAERIVKSVQSELSDPVKLQVVYRVDHDDVPLYMNAADALLLTSQREGFPNSVKEAMACNLPIVSTNVGGVRDRLEEVENSYVGTSESELVNSLINILRSDQRSNGQRYINDLSLDAMAANIIEVYKKALSRH